jgi:hypothetical protein
MKKNNSKLTYFGLIAFPALMYIANGWFSGSFIFHTRYIFQTPIFVIFLISSILFFVGLYLNFKKKKNKNN